MAFPRRAECRLPMFWFSSFKKIFPVIWRSGPHTKKTLRLFFQLDCIENRGKVDRGNEDEFKKNRLC